MNTFTYHDSLTYEFIPKAYPDALYAVYRADCSMLIQNGGLSGITTGPISEFDSTAVFVEQVWP